MPLTIPNFVQFQAPLFPLRGLWNASPPEGDRFVNAEIDWGTPGLTGASCVQFQLSGNSPVAFSQIVAMSVDNSRCGSDVDFIFPDSGFILTVPAFNQGVYPVFTNALMFYANSPLAVLGDVTIVQILNSMPPPVAIQPSSEQQQAGLANLNLNTNGTTAIIPASVAGGTIDAMSITIAIASGATGAGQLELVDGTGQILWETIVEADVGNTSINLTGLRLRFRNGVNAVVLGSTLTGVTFATINLYYSTP